METKWRVSDVDSTDTTIAVDRVKQGPRVRISRLALFRRPSVRHPKSAICGDSSANRNQNRRSCSRLNGARHSRRLGLPA